MHWIVFSYTVPAKPRSSFRVSVWRRLGRLGAISSTSGVYILPARDECVEALQWLAQETRQASGEALVMRVEQFEDLGDAELIERFNLARARDYETLGAQATALEKSIHAARKRSANLELVEAARRLRRRYLDITRIDYFNCPLAGPLAARIDAIEWAASPRSDHEVPVPSAAVVEFQGKRWITRPRPHVDRLACAWLIRRFIDPRAAIRYAPAPEPDEIAFDMSGARFGHDGNRCTFETLLTAFGLSEPALRTIAEIVHDIDLRDGLYHQPDTAGIDTVLSGWQLANYSDAELERLGLALFEGLYLRLTKAETGRTVTPPKRNRSR